ncbi:MAG: hypothetical protein EOP93_13685 [Lysobacteraceae bacterium]|nr:MAG: hypothetical protein EOP93_13685 [Xanthomonadaceae bacterium]
MAAERGLVERFSRAGLATWLLAGTCGWALLLWLAALLGMGGRIGDADPVQPGDLPRPKAAQPERIGPLTQYAEAAARPLFTADRRPRGFLASGQDDDGAASQSQTLDFILTGVLISPQVSLAILQPSGGGESQRVRVGNAPDGAGGWRLVEVQPRRAVFEGGGGQVALDLRAFGVAASPSAPAPQRAEPMADPQNRQIDAEGPAPPDSARIEEIRRRIEARRAQLRANAQDAPPPPGAVPD